MPGAQGCEDLTQSYDQKQEAFGKSSNSNTYNLGKSFSQGPGEEEKQPRRIKARTGKSQPGQDTGEDTEGEPSLPAFGANVLASASTESLKSTFEIYKQGDRHLALNICIFPVPQHFPRTAARTDTNHSMFRKRILRVKRTEISYLSSSKGERNPPFSWE